jgi:hypothetical protein
VDKLGKILPRVLARQPGRGMLAEAAVRQRLEQIVGGLAGGLESIELQGSTLVVVTGNPAFAHQLRLDGELLLARLNESSLPRKVSSLRVETGRRR